MSRIRILLLIPNFGTGGAERVFLTICRHLSREEFDVSVAVLSREVTEYRDDIPPDVRLTVLGVNRARYAIPSILSLIRRLKPDLVFCTTSELNLVMSVVARLRRGRERYVAREPSVASENNQRLPNSRARLVVGRTFYREFAAIVCQSTLMKQDLEVAFRLDPRKLHVISNPVDLNRIARLADSPPDLGYLPVQAKHVVAAGRLDQAKDFGLLLDAIAACQDPRIHLSILGSGGQLLVLEQKARELGIAARVHFLGYVENPFPYFRSALCLVISSRYEGMPNVALEALACGTPVVAFARVNGLDDLVDKCRGITLVAERSASSLAAALDHAVLEEADRKADVTSQSAREIVGQYARLFKNTVSARQ